MGSGFDNFDNFDKIDEEAESCIVEIDNSQLSLCCVS
ncbi:hypothetical protein ES703_27947 [subsurface metagenome]